MLKCCKVISVSLFARESVVIFEGKHSLIAVYFPISNIDNTQSIQIINTLSKWAISRLAILRVFIIYFAV